jgi:hypothetical protein
MSSATRTCHLLHKATAALYRTALLSPLSEMALPKLNLSTFNNGIILPFRSDFSRVYSQRQMSFLTPLLALVGPCRQDLLICEIQFKNSNIDRSITVYILTIYISILNFYLISFMIPRQQCNRGQHSYHSSLILWPWRAHPGVLLPWKPSP